MFFFVLGKCYYVGIDSSIVWWVQQVECTYVIFTLVVYS